MARRRARGRVKRRRSAWQHLISNNSGNNIAASVSTDNTLFQNSQGTGDDFTVVRIVGGVYLGLQGTPSLVSPIQYGIYHRTRTNAGTTALVANSDTDIGNENWMHYRVVMEFQADLVHHRIDDSVDMKVMRKLPRG